MIYILCYIVAMQPTVIQTARAIAVTLWTSKKILRFSNKYNCFHSGIFKSVETIYEMSYEEQGIGRSQFGIFGFQSHKRITWTPKYHFNVTGCSDWLKESGRND